MSDAIAMTPGMVVVLGLLAVTVYLFVSEIVRVDVAAILIMVALGLLSLFPALGDLVSVEDLFDGFASNAVISIIAVMIIGAGLDKTGVMSRVAALILRHGGSTDRKIVPLISGTVGVISSFMQNVGAAALFIPVVSRISRRTEIPMSRLMMPMGFCAILGGTITMIGSSPLILLNDLILNSNRALPPDRQMEVFGLFSVTPVGLALVAVGVAYFALAGRLVLPAVATEPSAEGVSTVEYFNRVYGLDYAIHELIVPANSPIVGKAMADAEAEDRIRVIATRFKGTNRISPPRTEPFEGPAVVALLCSTERARAFSEKYGLTLKPALDTFSDLLVHTNAGISEIVVPPGSKLVGRSMRDIWMRKTYGLSVLAIHRGGESMTEGLRDLPFQGGDTLVCHSSWETLARIARNRDFVVVTTGYPCEELRPQKVRFAVAFFLLALGLVLFTDVRLSVALLTGAMGMVVSRVLSIDEAYQAVGWSSVFLLGSLIPLGQAVETTGTAEWIAQQTLLLLGDVPTWLLQASIAVLATGFTLVMSNVGATVLLVPIAVNIAFATGADPALFALTVAIATSNSFLIPTHQVNALVMGPGGYKVTDYLRAGGLMTLLFLIVSLAMLNLVF